MKVSRRQFIGAGFAASLGAAPLGQPIGFQTYSVREMVGKDFEGALRQMAAMGYLALEMCSPPGYEKAGFGALVNWKAADLRKAIRAAGLKCESSHYNFREVREHLDERIAYAKDLGLKHMVVSSLGMKKGAAMEDWIRAADEMNKIGERTRKAGLQLGFHNHHGEFEKIGGVLIYDELLKRFDPKLVTMQFQVAVINIGYDASDYMIKHPGRFTSLHLADWSATEKKMVAVGKGVVDWKKLFTAARTGGVKNYFVEMNLDALRDSVPYLRALKA
jgi:sugar phosphate isomerase/epimerase